MKDRPEVVGAILAAPAFLSNMTEEEAAALRKAALGSTDAGKEANEIDKNVIREVPK